MYENLTATAENLKENFNKKKKRRMRLNSVNAVVGRTAPFTVFMLRKKTTSADNDGSALTVMTSATSSHQVISVHRSINRQDTNYLSWECCLQKQTEYEHIFPISKFNYHQCD